MAVQERCSLTKHWESHLCISRFKSFKPHQGSDFLSTSAACTAPSLVGFTCRCLGMNVADLPLPSIYRFLQSLLQLPSIKCEFRGFFMEAVLTTAMSLGSCKSNETD